MRSLLLWILLAIVLGGLVGMLAGQDPGYVLLAYGDHAVETSLWAAIVLLVLAYLAVRVVLWLFNKVFAGRLQLVSWTGNRRRNLANRRTREGVLALAQRDWRSAGRLLLDSAERSDTPFVNYLGAAQAAQGLGDYDGRDELLDKARSSTQGSEQAVAIQRAELQLAAGQAEQALATTLAAHESAPKQPAALSLLKRCYLALEDYAALGALLPKLRKAKLVDGAEEAELAGKIALSRLQASPTAEVWNGLPKDVRSDPDVVLRYAAQLCERGEDDVAASVLRDALNSRWDDRLVDRYGVLIVSDSADQASNARRWLKERPNNSRLLLALGRIALKQNEWSQAREYFEASVRLRHDADVAGELGRLCLALGEDTRASELLAQAAELPKLPLPER